MAGRKLIDGDAQGKHVSFVQVVELVIEQLPRQVSAADIQLRLPEINPLRDGAWTASMTDIAGKFCEKIADASSNLHPYCRAFHA